MNLFNNYTLDNNIMVRTTNGDFLIVFIEAEYGESNLCLCGAMFIDDEGDYPFEIQYIADGISELIGKIVQSEQNYGQKVQILEIINKDGTNQILDIDELMEKYS